MNTYLKTFLQAMGVGALIALVGILIWDAMAQPAGSGRLRDLTDVRLAPVPSLANGQVLLWDSARGRWTNGVSGGGSATNLILEAGTDQQILLSSNGVVMGDPLLRWDYDTERFLVGSSLGGRMEIDNATPHLRIYVGGNPATDFQRLMLEWSSSDQRYELRSQSSGASNAVPLYVGVEGGGIIINTDGTLSFAGTTNKLSIANNNLLMDGVPLVQDSPTIIYTNITVVTNSFSVGKGGTIIFTNNVQFPYTTLTLTGTNATQMNFTNTAFALTLSADGFIGTPAGLPGTGLMSTHMLHVKQDATGSRTLTLTNGSFIVNGSGTSTNAVLTINTNASAYTVVTLTSSPFEAGKVMAVVTTLGQ